MRMNFGEVLTIEDLGNHSAGTVIGLGILLAGTVNVTPDSKRKNSYEVEGGSTVYYVHVSPVSGTIFFLAAWEKPTAPREELHMADSVWSQAAFGANPRRSPSVDISNA
jgi:hypothetical protein